VYTIPEVAMAGDTEQAVHAAGIDYVIGRALHGQSTRLHHRRERRFSQADFSA
jgi:pyruvate/2-oxoglutarate dehydrogenase complex dihydrolipoamide dehydrogenase (E3) component